MGESPAWGHAGPSLRGPDALPKPSGALVGDERRCWVAASHPQSSDRSPPSLARRLEVSPLLRANHRHGVARPLAGGRPRRPNTGDLATATHEPPAQPDKGQSEP